MNLRLRENLATYTLLLTCIALCAVLLIRERPRTVTILLAHPVDIDQEPQQIRAADAAAQMLDHVIPTLDLGEHATLGSALDIIAREGNCKIDVHWENLNKSEVSPATPVGAFYGIHRYLTVREALRQIIHNDDVGFTIGDGAIVIDTDREVAKNTVIVVYNVRDIIDQAIAFARATDPPGQPTTAQEIIDGLTKLLTDYVAPDGWRDNGGNVASIRDMAGLLIIQQSPENHREIEQLLDEVRRMSRIDPAKYYAAKAGRNDAKESIDPAETALSKLLPQLPPEPPQTLQEALRIIGGVAGSPMLVEWNLIKAAGVEPTTPVDLPWPLQNMTVRDALNIIVRSAGDSVQLGVTRKKGLIIITTIKGLEDYNQTASYDIRDLIQSLTTPPAENAAPLTTDEALAAIEMAMNHTIDPDSWRENGGNLGSSHFIMGILFVQQTPDNQKAIRQMLREMRAANQTKPAAGK